ncbi:MAG: hypothetical protein QXD09_05390 [Candidatus Caldarchaeum sp.]
MAGTVSTDLAFFVGATGGSSSADSLTDWTGSGLAVDTVQFVQGTGSIYSYLAASSTTRYWNFACVSTNIQGKAIYFWFALGKVGWLNTKANGGLTFKVTDANGNWALWNVAGSDTLPHNGFICHCVHTSVTPDSQSATPPNLTAITSFEIRANGSFPGKAYLWVDAVRYGTYVQIKGGTSSAPATFEDIYAAESDVANRWGILDKVNGIYFVQGKILIGSTTSGEATYFKDTNQVVVFKYAIVPAGFYEIKIQGNPGAETSVYFGIKVGTAGISGCVFRTAPGATPFLFTATDENITNLGIYGCSFFDASTISLPTYSTTREVLTSNFEASAPVQVSTCTVKYSKFINADDAGIIVSSTAFNVSYCDFIGCPYGVRITVTGTFTFDALMFTGNTYDIDNTSGGLVTVNCTHGSNPTTYTGNTVIQTALTLTVRKVKTGAEPNKYVRVSIHRADTMQEIMNKDADVPDDLNPGYYKATTSYVGPTGFTIIVRAREAGWLPYEISLTMPSTDLDITAVWIPDPNYSG